MAVPKRKTSKSVRGKRRTHKTLDSATISTCTSCGEYKASHCICLSCGSYSRKTVLNKKNG